MATIQTSTPPETPKPEPRTWKPTTAGILTIIAGILNVIVGIVISAVAGAASWFVLGIGVGAAIGVPLIIIGILSIIGGIYATQRRHWGLALVGAILALFPPPIIVLGILAIIFMTMGKKEFA